MSFPSKPDMAVSTGWRMRENAYRPHEWSLEWRMPDSSDIAISVGVADGMSHATVAACIDEGWALQVTTRQMRQFARALLEAADFSDQIDRQYYIREFWEDD